MTKRTLPRRYDSKRSFDPAGLGPGPVLAGFILLLLTGYLVFSLVWTLTGAGEPPQPTPTRTRPPTFTRPELPMYQPVTATPLTTAPAEVPLATPPTGEPSAGAPTATQTPTLPTAASSVAQTHTVAPGESLLSIAAMYGVSYEALLAANPRITDPDLVVVGQKIVIPTTGATESHPSIPRTHRVAPGESLLGIAQTYGVDYQALMRLNRITNPNRIYVDQKLLLPQPGQPRQQMRVHIVQAGETLLAIAGRYGVTLEALMEANGIHDPDVIYTGQKLVIP
ncbi:MAG TPA: LysM peptidoglycan-binding domain-containing protein [Anaerolineae bacterium]|nr:LysM peptidoglycan-binding domain-containing protein [Anaerolineae bacterium]HIQ05219.1 LysM peptidoglycan-binding domain-containing protein [Anaerolineae bacterium]